METNFQFILNKTGKQGLLLAYSRYGSKFKHLLKAVGTGTVKREPNLLLSGSESLRESLWLTL